MISRNIRIINKLGLHARAAAKFVTLAGQYSSHIQLANNGLKVNGKSIMGVMMLAAARGTSLTLITEGEDERDAADALQSLVNERFGEDE
jgi:phosphocarrier protein HPr